MIYYTKSLIKRNKLDGITPMKTHIEFAHPGLVAWRKLVMIIKKIIMKNHN
jgi:hypothetical protein